MKIQAISYQKHWNNEGTCYTQLIKIDKELQQRYNNKINRLKRKINKNIDKNHCFTNEEMDILYFTKSLKKGINYTKLTGLREFGKFLINKGLYNKRIFLNRNTIIEVL